MSRPRFGLAVGLALGLVLAAAPSGIGAEPKPRSISYYYDAIYQSLVRPPARVIDPAFAARWFTSKREAANVDENDDVRLPTTWWQPRLGFKPVTPEQMLRGASPGGPPSGKWRVVRAKTEGVSLGFQIVDATNARFAVKFDPVGSLEMATGAEVVASRLYWAAGYNVPDNTIIVFRREDAALDPKASFTDVAGRKVPMTENDLNALLAKVAKHPDGSYRAVASRFLPGKPLGEWKYSGRRSDDPEDLIPHQLRREIRGTWGINAWLNHTDCSARNTLDTWVTEGGRSFVRHHLIDFSGCLGSGSIAPQDVRNGHENLFDYGATGMNLTTLGLRTPRWEHSIDPEIPAVGFLDSETFNPGHWKPFLPNPAFDDRTERDVRWGVRIVAAFTDDHIRAAVAEGRYTDPRAAEYLVRVLIERRDKLVARWLRENSAAD